MENRVMKKLLRLDAQKKELEEELDEVKKARKEVEEKLLDQFAKAGVKSMNVDGKTVYLHKQLWATPKNKDGGRAEVCAVLKSLGMGREYVVENFNTNSLSAFVRELDEQNEELDVKLQRVLNVVAKFSLRVRKG